MAKDWTFTAGAPVEDSVRGAATRGLHLAAEHVLTEANDRVPIEEGTLQRSGRASSDPEEVRAAVSYDTPYAVPVHEDMAARHDDGRTAKWLELTLAEQADTVRRIVADTIRGAL